MKKIFLCASAVVSVLAGCSESEISGVNTSAPGYMRLTAAATRAKSTLIEDMRGDGTGFQVYALTYGANTWYDAGGGEKIDGSNHHRYNSGEWGFTTPVHWPAATGDYPMTFYAWYPIGATGFSVTAEDYNNLKGSFTVAATPATQIDLLAARAQTTTNKPAHDMLDIVFHHILAKVNYGFNVDAGYTAHVQSIKLCNVADTRTFDFIADKWTDATEPVSTACTIDYTYLSTANPAKQFVGAGANAAVFAPGENANMLLMPQVVAAQKWEYPSSLLPADLAYVRVVYRLDKTSLPAEPDYIGYAEASRHPNYVGGYSGPLFVAVGYSFDLNWAKGKAYNYFISLPGGSGGVLLEQNFLDETGGDSGLPVRNLEPGDQILGDSFIHLIPAVSEWSDATATILNN